MYTYMYVVICCCMCSSYSLMFITNFITLKCGVTNICVFYIYFYGLNYNSNRNKIITERSGIIAIIEIYLTLTDLYSTKPTKVANINMLGLWTIG